MSWLSNPFFKPSITPGVAESVAGLKRAAPARALLPGEQNA